MPAIWRQPGVAGAGGERSTIQHGQDSRGSLNWRILSALIVVATSTALLLFFAADSFYVRDASVGGLRYVSKAEIFELSGVRDLHLFWVDPVLVRENILRSPSVADVSVSVDWPPRGVQIVVQEREPALTWEQNGAMTWIDLQGRVMRQWEDRQNLLRVQADPSIEGTLNDTMVIDRAIVEGAVQLHSLRPDLNILRYSPFEGLGFRETNGWWAWFGTGTTMPERLLIYNTIVADLQSRGLEPLMISVVDLDAPYYCTERSGCPEGQ